MFEKLRQTLRDALQSASGPEDRRAVVAEMKATLVQARLGVDDLRTGVERTRVRLAAERHELETVQRRRALAAGINDAETVTVADRYARQHTERVDVLERKLDAEVRDLALAEAEVAEMLADFKGAAGGAVPPPARHAAAAAAEVEDLERDPLRDSLDQMGRAHARAAREAAADDQLAALKRRMGQ